MKKIFLIVAVLMLATPALATTVDVWAEQVGDTNQVEIWYEVDPPPAGPEDGNRPRAFGLNITVSDDVNIVDCAPALTGECNSVDRGYGIFPGTISISGNVVSDYGSPVAPGDDPGAEGTGLDTNTIVVEMGSLYTGANTPDPCGLLCTITLDIETGECDVYIAGNAARTGIGSEGKGVVLENLLTPAVNFIPGHVTLPLAECFPSTAEYANQYADWVALGKPDCWCAPYQCDGDTAVDDSGPLFYYRIYTSDLSLLMANWKKKIADPTLDPCADIDHKDSGPLFYYRVYTGDLSRLMGNWKKKDAALPGNCPRPD